MGKAILSGILPLLLVAGLVGSSIEAANGPFVGKWRIEPSKSNLYDEIKLAGANAAMNKTANWPNP